jgi:23S rRNA pseudouridine2605 synthase
MEKPNRIRVNRFLAMAGLASRRGADRIILEGRVTLNGERLAAVGATIDPSRDTLAVDGVEVLAPGRRKTVKFHKPRGVLSTLHDPSGRTDLTSYLRGAGFSERYFPVGRLDRDTTGLLLLTTDGALCFRLTHPSFKVEKTYQVLVRGDVTRTDLASLREGLVLEDGPTLPCRARVLRSGAEGTWLELVVREGRKRQVRRMMDALGHRVEALHRPAVGPIALEELPEGRFRKLDQRETRTLYGQVDLPPPL